MTDAIDATHMARALRLAERGLYTCDPNPRVGCVIAHGERVVGTGHHAVAGQAHAEAVALQDAGHAARGATAYVSLEPCCHHGRTPPCTEALLEAGVARVVYPLRDPDPRVAGQGARTLEAGGVRVDRLDAFAPAARSLNIGFVKRLAAGRPWIRVKLAASLDGRTALASGESRWITGEAAREDVHRWRARSSWILTGSGTVLADDPRLDVRLDAAALGIEGEIRQPGVAIADSRLRTSAEARPLRGHRPVAVYAGQGEAAPEAARALQSAGAEVVEIPRGERGLEPGALFADLAARDANEVHVEAGATLCGGLLASGYVDELVVYLAPSLLGEGARGLLAFGPLASMAERVRLHVLDTRMVGPDIRIRALPIIARE